MHETKWRVYSLKPLKFMEVGLSTHNKRYNSDDIDPLRRKSKRDHNKLNSRVQESTYKLKLMKEIMLRKNGSAEARKRKASMTTMKPNNNAQSSLNEEIENLQKQLQDQFAVRHALENALSHNPSSHSHDSKIDDSIPKPTKELIKEITVLELEILCLERYLLTLYRQMYSSTNPAAPVVPQKPAPPSEVSGHPVSPLDSVGNRRRELREDALSAAAEKLILDPSIHRSHSSLSQRSACNSFRASPGKFVNKAVDLYHSLPLSMLEQAESTTTPNASLVEHCCSDHIPETPNSLSEDMIRCISTIYCELADPPLTNDQDYSSSPAAFSSSSIYNEKRGSIGRKNIPVFNSDLDSPFQGLVGPYFRMIKIQWLCRDAEKLGDIENMLQKFRSLVYRLEDVDLRKMKHEEKLAFWINVHNSLVMHAFLVYGIPQNNLKRVSLVLKAAYNIGGHTISVDTIQNSILGCRLPRPGQWLRLLFSSKTRFKVGGDARKAFAIERPEPLLHFSLCSGSLSDPAVRVYTPKGVFEEMETARGEYIRSNLIVHKEHKILLPKIVESFAKDSGLSTAYLVEMIEHLIPDSRRKFIHHHHHQLHKKSLKGIEWIPHNFTFHYLISKEATW